MDRGRRIGIVEEPSSEELRDSSPCKDFETNLHVHGLTHSTLKHQNCGLAQVHTHSAEDTLAFGSALAACLKPGDVICLFGDLGAGKTTLIKGIVGALTPTDPDTVCSPTYAFLNIYPGPIPVFHFDLYRLEDSEAFLSLGFEEYLFGKGICCIEWSERIETILPSFTQRITLEHAGEVKRTIIHEIPKSPLPDNCCSEQKSSYLR